MRLAPILNLTGVLLDFSASQDTPEYNVGGVMVANPTNPPNTGTNVPNWIASELLYVRYTGSVAMLPGRLVVLDKDATIADLPNTANLNRAVFVSVTNFTAGNVTPQYGWVMKSGIAPVQYSVAATTGPTYFAAAGQATPTLTAGKQVVGMNCLIAAASAFTRSAKTSNGLKRLQVNDVSGMFVGQAVSGTGIAASSTIASIDPSGQSITLNNAMTATGTATITFTPTGYGICHFNDPYAQGNIT